MQYVSALCSVLEQDFIIHEIQKSVPHARICFAAPARKGDSTRNCNTSLDA